VEATPRRLSGRLKSLENPAVLGGEGAAATGFAEVSEGVESSCRPFDKTPLGFNFCSSVTRLSFATPG